MVQTKLLKSVFERIISRSNRVLTPYGIYQVTRTSVRIIAVGKLFAVALYRGFEYNGVSEDYVVARSFPMSYKSAHRLVCSL